LSGRDTTAVQKTMSGLLKLMFPNSESEIPDDAIEWAARLALESRRRVKEQQKRIGSVEFRNTHFSFTMPSNGMEHFVTTPELQSEDSIGEDPLPSGQVWVMSPGGMDENPGLFRIECNGGPGSGVRILNQSPAGPLKESVKCAEQNLYARAKELVGDRDPRGHEYTLQVRAFDASKSGTATGVGVLLALCSALLEKPLKGGLAIVGGINLGGSIEPIYNASSVVEAAADKGAKNLLMPVSTRKQLLDLPDEIATKVNISFYTDAREALVKAISD
jgi:ATP-dependent Lon protease